MNYEIITERLVLRPPCMDDVIRLYHLMSDSRLTHFLTWEPHANIETTKVVISSLLDSQLHDKGYHWCILHNNLIIGLASLIDVRRKIRTWTLNRAELSYWIGSRYQGNGFATESSKGIIDFGFNKLGLHKIIVGHALENVESKSICNNLNFIQFAIEHDGYQKNNLWHDLIWYELIKSKDEVD